MTGEWRIRVAEVGRESECWIETYPPMIAEPQEMAELIIKRWNDHARATGQKERVLLGVQIGGDEEYAKEFKVRSRGVPDVSVYDLAITSRTSNALRRHGIATLSQLAVTTERRLMSIRGIGRSGVDEIRDLLGRYKLEMRA